MKTLVFGAGNLLLSDEGFGVHFIQYLQNHYVFTEDVELYDGGTLGIMVTHLLEEADRVYLVDVVDTKGEPGDVFRFEKEEFLLGKLPIKMSPHQIGIQEVLTLSDLRGRTPDTVTLFGVIPASYEAGVELSPILATLLPKLADTVVQELRAAGHEITDIP
ncbi:HyaD/HybD family hydrogenase maturation endopeptidase [Geobacter pelophilus]|uniref:HyaD/HybD family hydrogenase maturation endopeptidase n=1 Tax=Geoanaerobacter pelophilus TaxID=60036 RepID=A0AAW4L738_9BACT|nr:HyaD/HybD family hydrogenase maturation endopeptidase [Geoanaerobacter pelophilus]MBT0665367.1 HyaD/HybD family hydrogenase maturation endopeptidase [Geoanaerobacter pelophilus]